MFISEPNTAGNATAISTSPAATVRFRRIAANIGVLRIRKPIKLMAVATNSKGMLMGTSNAFMRVAV